MDNLICDMWHNMWQVIWNVPFVIAKQIVLRNVRNNDKLIDRKLRESTRNLETEIRNWVFLFLESIILIEIKMETTGNRW